MVNPKSVDAVGFILGGLNPSYEVLMKDPDRKILRPQMSYSKIREMFRQALTDLGLVVDQPDQVKKWLEEQKFFSGKDHEGREIGVIEVLGIELYEELVEKAHAISLRYFTDDLSDSQPDKGVVQALADILALSICDPVSGEKAWKLFQRRLWKGLMRLWTHRKSSFPAGWRESVNGVFEDLEPPTNTLASCPAGGALEIWNFMVSKLLDPKS